MSLFQMFAKSLASESGELKKIRVEAEKRRATKSSSELPKVEEVIDRTVVALSQRIESSKRSGS